MAYTETQNSSLEDHRPMTIDDQLSGLQEKLQQKPLPEITNQSQLDRIFADTTKQLYVIVLGFEACQACPAAKASVEIAIDQASKQGGQSIIGGDLDVVKYPPLLAFLKQKSGKVIDGYPQLMMIQGGKIVYYEQGSLSSQKIMTYLSPEIHKMNQKPSSFWDAAKQQDKSEQDTLLAPKKPLTKEKKEEVAPPPSGFWDTTPATTPESGEKVLKPQEGPLANYPHPTAELPKVTEPAKKPMEPVSPAKTQPAPPSKITPPQNLPIAGGKKPESQKPGKEVLKEKTLTLSPADLQVLALPLLTKNPRISGVTMKVTGDDTMIMCNTSLTYDTKTRPINKTPVEASVNLNYSPRGGIEVSYSNIDVTLGDAIIEKLAAPEIKNIPITLKQAIEEKYSIKVDKMRIEDGKLVVNYKSVSATTKANSTQGPTSSPPPPVGPEKMPSTKKDRIMGKIEKSKAGIIEVPDQYCRFGQKEYLNSKVIEDFGKMHEACLQATGVNMKVTSGYRSFADQKAIREKKRTGQHPFYQGLDKNFPDPVARAKEIMKRSSMPGTSRHHRGTDFDISFEIKPGKWSVLENSDFATETGKKLYKRLSENAATYGFCQPYSNKSDGRTGYNQEKRHRSHIALARDMMRMAKDLQDTDISGFLGSETAVKIGVVDNYMFGVSEECRK